MSIQERMAEDREKQKVSLQVRKEGIEHELESIDDLLSLKSDETFGKWMDLIKRNLKAAASKVEAELDPYKLFEARGMMMAFKGVVQWEDALLRTRKGLLADRESCNKELNDGENDEFTPA